MRAFLLGNSLYFFHKHESFDGKDSSRRSTNSTIAWYPREVHESGSRGSLRAVVREIDNTRVWRWGGRCLERARGDALLRMHTVQQATAALRAVHVHVCVAHSGVCQCSGESMRRRAMSACGRDGEKAMGWILTLCLLVYSVCISLGKRARYFINFTIFVHDSHGYASVLRLSEST